MAIKFSAAPQKAELSLRQMLHKHIQYVEEERDPANLNASTVTWQEREFCAREPIIRRQLKIPLRKKRITTAEAVTFEWGRETERRVQRWFRDMGMAVGDWKCAHKPCGKLHRWQTQPKACGTCGGESFIYEERRAYSKLSGIGCGLDLVLNVGKPKLRLLEVKSLDKDKFKDLAGPYAEHKIRTQLYLRCIDESEDPQLKDIATDAAKILYVSKGGYGTMAPDMLTWDFQDGKFSPFKEYVIERSDERTDALVARARAAWEALQGGAMPERICSSLSSPRAQDCPAAQACFNAKGW